MILAIVLLGYLMILLDTSIVITGLPAIGAELGLDPLHLSWVQNIYTLSFGALLLCGSRAGDTFGRRRVLNVGLLLFGLSSLAISLAPNAAVLIGARFVQGAGAAIIAPATLALITEFFPEGPQRLRATSAYGAVAGIGVALGMVLGGIFAQMLSWRVGFIINVPLAILLYWMASRVLPKSVTKQGSLDLPGTIFSASSIALILYAVVMSAEQGWGSPLVLASLIAGLVLFGVFLWNESRATSPLMPLTLFRDRSRNAALVARFLLVGSVMSYFFFATQLMQDNYDFTPLQAGFTFLPMSLLQFFSASFVPRLSRAGFSNRTLLISGLVFMVIAMAGLAFIPQSAGITASLIIPIGLLGAAQGIAFGPLTSMSVQGAQPEESGAVSGLVNSVHQIGGTFGVGVFSALAVTFLGNSTAPEMVLQRAHLGFFMSTLALSLATAIAIFFIKKQKPEHQD